jgi:hypothetical protein
MKTKKTPKMAKKPATKTMMKPKAYGKKAAKSKKGA